MTKKFNLALPWKRSSPECTTDGCCSALGLAATPRVQNPPTGRDREKIYQYKPNSQGYPENSFVLQRKGGKNTGPCLEGQKQ